MPVFGEQDYPEEIRLKYRFLDLRREQAAPKYHDAGARSSTACVARMKEQGFFEFQTPDLDRLLA